MERLLVGGRYNLPRNLFKWDAPKMVGGSGETRQDFLKGNIGSVNGGFLKRNIMG